VLSGLGKNVPICEKIVGTLNSLSIQANFLHTNTAVHGDLGMIRKNDLVLVLSKSGSTAESVTLAKLLVQRGCNSWAVTFSRGSLISRILKKELSLNLKNEGDDWNIVPNNSSSVYLILLQGLSLQLAEKMGVTLDDFRKNHPGGAIGEKLRGRN
jgi:arabinose-5-phosphate isomerase